MAYAAAEGFFINPSVISFRKCQLPFQGRFYRKEELFFVFLFFVHFEFEMFAAVGAIHFAFVNDAAVDADNFAACGAFYFVEVVAIAIAIIVAAAVAVAIVVAAIAIVVEFIIIIFKSFEVFVDKFNLFANFCKSVLNVFYIVCEIFEDVNDCVENFVVAVKTFHKSFEMCNFFSNSHDNFSFAVKN